MVFAIFIATKGSSWAGVITQAPSGAASLLQIAGEVGAATLLGAIAFAGAGGANNLVQSNYVRDKGLAMGANIPNIVSGRVMQKTPVSIAGRRGALGKAGKSVFTGPLAL